MFGYEDLYAICSVKLKKIRFFTKILAFKRFSFQDIDNERMKLNDVNKLKIYLLYHMVRLDDFERNFNRIDIRKNITEVEKNQFVDMFFIWSLIKF